MNDRTGHECTLFYFICSWDRVGKGRAQQLQQQESLAGSYVVRVDVFFFEGQGQ